MQKIIKRFCLILCVLSLIAFYGCAGLEVAMENSQVQVESSLDNVPFFDSHPGQTVFINIKNYSNFPELNYVENYVKQKYQERGFTVTNDYNKADWIMQAKIVNIKKEDFSARQIKGGSSLNGGIAGAGAGALAGAALGGNSRDVIAGALIGGVLTGAANLTVNSWVKLGYLTIITDIQVQERKNQAINSSAVGVQKIGNVKQKYNIKDTTNMMKYRFQALTRVKKANLDWEDCKDIVTQEITRILSSLL